MASFPDPHEGGAPGVPASEVEQPAQPEVEESEDEAEEQSQPDTESEPEVSLPQPPPPAPPPPSDEARRRARDRDRIERLERENSELRSRQAAQIGDINAEVERRMGPPPKEADYRGDYLEYDRDVTAYKFHRRIVEHDIRTQVQRDQAFQYDRMRDAYDKHQDRVADFKQKAPDFDDVLKAADAQLVQAGITQVSDNLQGLMLQSDHSAQLAYYFGQNPQYFAQVNQMSPLDQARVIGSLEAQMAVPSSRTRQQTRAPAPVRPLVGGAAPPSQDRELEAYLSRKYGKR